MPLVSKVIKSTSDEVKFLSQKSKFNNYRTQYQMDPERILIRLTDLL